MNRGQFALMLVTVALAGLLGGVVSDWTRGAPAEAQELRRAGPIQRLSRQKLTELARFPFPEFDPPPTTPKWIEGELLWATYDQETHVFGVIMKLKNSNDTVMVRTNQRRMQAALETAYGHDDDVAIEVVPQSVPAALMPMYKALYMQMYPK